MTVDEMIEELTKISADGFGNATLLMDQFGCGHSTGVIVSNVKVDRLGCGTEIVIG